MRALPHRLLVPVLCAILTGCSPRQAADSAATPGIEVPVAIATARTFTESEQSPGQWKASVESILPAPFDAIVESLAVRPGERVRAGAVVAWCRTAESDAVLRGAELLARQANDARSRDDANRALAEARASVIRVPLASPASGIVVRRQADVGSRLASGAELLAIVADDALVFETRVPLSEGIIVRAGMRATIEDGDGPPIAARVWTLPPSSAGDQSTLVWLRPDAAPAHLALGRFGQATITTGRTISALTVPDSAVVEDDLSGRHRVALVDSGGVVRWLDVELGARDGHARAVRSPDLAPGAAVVVDGQRALTDGMHVAIRR